MRLCRWLPQHQRECGFQEVTWEEASDAAAYAKETAWRETDKATYQAMEALVHNLNTMNSRAGAQVPFSSLNYGTDTSEQGRMVIHNLLLATEAGLGDGETPIFPVQIFKVKEGVNYKEGDQVRINDGPLESFTGVVEEIDAEKNKVTVVVSMFGRETPVEMELDQVEVVS